MRPGSSRLMLAFGLAITAAFAQSAARQDAPPGSVSGIVVNAISGAPIEHSHVTLSHFTGNRLDAYSAHTDSDGKFSFPKLQPVGFSVAARKSGFVDDISTVTIRPGEKASDLKLILTPTGSISGRVLDPDGEPHEGYRVAVRASGTASAGSGGSSDTTTDEKGRYRIGGLNPGKYRVSAWSNLPPFPPEIRSDGTKDVHLARTYFPGVLDAKSAQKVEVGAGADVSGIDIHLIATRIVSVSGTVAGVSEGRDVEVQLERQEAGRENSGEGSFPTFVKEDGSFRLWNLDPGKYMLRAISQPQPGEQTPAQSAPVEIDVAGADIEHIALRLISPFDIAGQIVYDDPDARLQPNANLPPPRGAVKRRIGIQPESSGQSFSRANVSADIADDDSFTLEKLTPGRDRLSVSWGAFVKSVRLGSNETEGDVLDIRNGPGGPLTVTLSSKTTSISGTVSDSKGPAAGVRVTLYQDSLVVESALSDNDGAYQFAKLKPGKYTVKVEVDESGDNDKGETIELHAGDHLTKDLTKR